MAIKRRARSSRKRARTVQEQILHQRPALPKQVSKKIAPAKFIKLGIPGFDDLFEYGIPKGSTVLLCGGPGSGKTILGLQIAYHAALQGKKCLYLTFEEDPIRLREHMIDFGWDSKLEKEELIRIQKVNPFDITRQIEAMLERAKGELLIDIRPILFPDKFIPEIVVIDSLSAIAAAFMNKEETYRIYIEQLFTLLQETGATSFLISESTDVVTRLSASGVEEFLADGIIILYNIRSGNVRENALEILKMRGAKFQKRVVAMQIIAGKGIVIYPEQEVFGTT